MSSLPDIGKFLLRPNKEKLRNAIGLFKGKMPEEIRKNQDFLIEYMAKKATQYGYDVKELEFRLNEYDYNTKIGLGIFAEGEKYDDLRGFIHNLYEECSMLINSHEQFMEKYKVQQDNINQICKNDPDLAKIYFPEEFNEEDEDDE